MLKNQPDWWLNSYWQRYAGCQFYTINRYINTSFQAQIDTLTLNEETGRLTFILAWSAVGVDANNRRSLTERTAWVHNAEPLTELNLWANLDGARVPLYTARPVSDGRLILDGGELMEAVFTFLPQGSTQMISPSDIRPDDPDYPVDRTVRYVAGRMPGGTTLSSRHVLARYEADADGDPRRTTLGDDGT